MKGYWDLKGRGGGHSDRSRSRFSIAKNTTCILFNFQGAGTGWEGHRIPAETKPVSHPVPVHILSIEPSTW